MDSNLVYAPPVLWIQKTAHTFNNSTFHSPFNTTNVHQHNKAPFFYPINQKPNLIEASNLIIILGNKNLHSITLNSTICGVMLYCFGKLPIPAYYPALPCLYQQLQL